MLERFTIKNDSFLEKTKQCVNRAFMECRKVSCRPSRCVAGLSTFRHPASGAYGASFRLQTSIGCGNTRTSVIVDGCTEIVQTVVRCRSPLEAVTMRTAEFAHTFLFRCPVCNGASTVVCFKSESNLETADEDIFRAKCLCGWIGELNGFMAVRHWVVEWEPVGLRKRLSRSARAA